MKLLHLEDDPLDHELLRERLASEGFAVDCEWANNAGDYRKALARGPFDVIVSDFGLPGYDGITALREARQVYPDTPFIFVSGTIGEERAIGAMRAGATDYVLKDRLERLPDVLRRALAEAHERAERKRVEAELFSSREQLVQAQRLEAVGRLAGGIAHDFNNVLGVILGYSDLMLSEMKPDDANHEPMTWIKDAAMRAASLTRQLLAFSRRQVLQPRVMDLRTTLTDLDRMLRRLIGEDVKLTLTFPAELGNIRADPGQMEQVVMNLVVNARDAMPRGGAISVRVEDVTRDGKPYVRLSVGDTGTGIPPEIISKIFEPFFTTKPRDRGTGLGLSTVYGIVEQSGGTIDVDSQVGQGTTFRIDLPRVDAAVEPKTAPGAERDPDKAAAAPRTVLVVEDQAEVRKLTVRLLRSAGYQVLEAADPEQARALAKRDPRRIDLLVTDVVMPQGSGVELARELTALAPGLRVLLMSGYTDDAIEHHGVLGTHFAFLEKPFTQATLTGKVAEVFSSAPVK